MSVTFADVKEVLDYCLGDHPNWSRIARKHRNQHDGPNDPHLFGWDTETQLLNAKARGYWLINPEFRGNGKAAQTNLIRILTQVDGLFGYPRMPLVGNKIDMGSERCQILIDWINNLPSVFATENKAMAIETTCTPEERFLALGEELPPYPNLPPKFNFVQAKRVGEILYVSGMGPQNGSGFDERYIGKIWDDLSIADGVAAARLTGLNLLHVVRRHLGSLNKVEQILEIFGMVNGSDNFKRNPEVINGCSDLMVEIFGEEKGKHVRTASGADTPFDIAVYLNMTVHIKNDA